MKRPQKLIGTILRLCVIAACTSGFASSYVFADERTDVNRFLTTEDYQQLEYFLPWEISNDGRWFAYVVSRKNEPGAPKRLTIRSIDGDQCWTIEGALGAQFSDDSRWVVYARSAGNGGIQAVLRDLVSGEEKNFELAGRPEFHGRRSARGRCTCRRANPQCLQPRAS